MYRVLNICELLPKPCVQKSGPSCRAKEAGGACKFVPLIHAAAATSRYRIGSGELEERLPGNSTKLRISEGARGAGRDARSWRREGGYGRLSERGVLVGRPPLLHGLATAARDTIWSAVTSACTHKHRRWFASSHEAFRKKKKRVAELRDTDRIDRYPHHPRRTPRRLVPPAFSHGGNSHNMFKTLP